MGAAWAYYTLFSLVFGTVMVALGEWWGRHLLGRELPARGLNEAATFALTAVLFTVGKALITPYVGSTNVVSDFGAAGSLIVLLIWVYCSAQVFLLEAEFTWVHARRFGSRREGEVVGVPSPQ